MIKLIPAITIREGKIVKMAGGEESTVKIYEKNPVDMAKSFADVGIEVIHMVDLDGAKSGTPKNIHILEAIAHHTDLKVDFTGGVNTDFDVEKIFECGATFITASSIAANDKEMFASWITSYGREKIAMAVDVKHNEVVVGNWKKKVRKLMMPILHGKKTPATKRQCNCTRIITMKKLKRNFYPL